MDETEQMLIERACTRLVHEYCNLVDHGRASEIADLFTSDGVWTSPAATMTGHDELRAGFMHRQQNTARRSRHVCTNVLIDVDVDDADHATGTVYLTLYRHDGDPAESTSPLVGPVMVGEYQDTFQREPGGWRFATRRCTVEFFAEA